MVIRNSKILLDQLSELERKIYILESFVKNQNLQVDQEELLKAMVKEGQSNFLWPTEKTN